MYVYVYVCMYALKFGIFDLDPTSTEVLTVWMRVVPRDVTQLIPFLRKHTRQVRFFDLKLMLMKVMVLIK